MSDIAEIARRMTKAQRAFLLETQGDYRFVSGYKPGEKLVELGLLKRKTVMLDRRTSSITARRAGPCPPPRPAAIDRADSGRQG